VFIIDVRGAVGQFRDGLRLPLRYQLTDLGHQVARDVHYSFGRRDASFILGKGIFLSLVPVVRQDSSDLLFIPSRGELTFAHGCFFLLLTAERDQPFLSLSTFAGRRVSGMTKAASQEQI